MVKTSKKRNSPQKTLFKVVAIFLIVLLIVLGILIFTNQQRANVDCNQVISKAQDSIISREYKRAYDELNAYKDICGKAVTKNESPSSKILKLRFHSRLAVAAYGSDKKTLAKEEAKKGLAIMDKNLNDAEKQSVQSDLITDMALVQDGVY